MKMYTSKTKQHINSSITCFSKRRSLERPGCACDRKKHVTIYLTASLRFTARTDRGAPQQRCWRGSSSQAPACRRRLPALCPADHQPGIEKPLRLAGVGHIPVLNPSDLSSTPERTPLPSSLEVSASTPTAALQ